MVTEIAQIEIKPGSEKDFEAAVAKARAVLYGRYHATIGDVQAVAPGALRHRIAPNYAAQAAGVDSNQLIAKLMAHIPADKKYARPSM